MSDMFLPHGGRPTKNGRKRKGVDDYVVENPEDFTSCSLIRGGHDVQCIVCRFCCQSIGARSDRIKEHLDSKRHKKLKILKLAAIREAQEKGQDVTQFADIGSGSLVSKAPVTNGHQGTLVSKDEQHQQPQQLLRVKWPEFASNRVSMFSKLRSQALFVDATILCEGKGIKCHKMILSACSTYFESLLTKYPNPHPIIFLKDMRLWEIQALVEFMYGGEVTVPKEELPKLLHAAECLQIKGLCSLNNDLGRQGANLDSMNEDMSKNTMGMAAMSQSGGNMPLSPPLSVGYPQPGNASHGIEGGPASNSRKKEAPKRVDLPRTAGIPSAVFNSTVDSETEDAVSDDSFGAHERDQVDLSMLPDKSSYFDNVDYNQAENYEENDMGFQGEEEDISSEHDQEMYEVQDGALISSH